MKTKGWSVCCSGALRAPELLQGRMVRRPASWSHTAGRPKALGHRVAMRRYGKTFKTGGQRPPLQEKILNRGNELKDLLNTQDLAFFGAKNELKTNSILSAKMRRLTVGTALVAALGLPSRACAALDPYLRLDTGVKYGSDPSPGPPRSAPDGTGLRLVKAPAAGHPLPKGEAQEFLHSSRCLLVRMYAPTHERHNVRMSDLGDDYGINHPWPSTERCDASDRGAHT